MPKQITSYLDNLKFDSKLYDNIVSKYLLNIRIVVLILIGVIAIGTVSFFNLPRRLNPEVKIPLVVVSTVLPGAGPDDVEQLVTIPLEDKLLGLEDLSVVNSTSSENISLITVEFESSVDPDDAKDEVQSVVDTVIDLPDDAQDPTVIKVDFENQPIWQFAITSSSSNASLMRFAENLQEELEDLPEVDNVGISGFEEQEIQIIIKSEEARAYEIDALTLSKLVKSAVPSYPAGVVNTNNSSFALTIDPTVESIEDLRNLVIEIDGQNVRLSQIATIIERSKPAQAKSFLARRDDVVRRAITLSVFRTKTINIDTAVEAVEKVTSTRIKDRNGQFELFTITNSAEEINEQFDDLLGSFRLTLFLVFLILFLFLGIRQALIVAFAIPLSFLISFAAMSATGLTINFLSLFSLIMALGLLVDTAIVIITAITRYYGTGKFTPNEAGLLVLRDFRAPIWATTLTTVWAFVPMLLVTGIIGEFIKSMPVIISTTLLASASISLLITLPITMILLKPNFPNRVRIMLKLIVLIALIAFIALIAQGNPFLPIIILTFITLIVLTYKFRSDLSNSLVLYLSNYFNVKKYLKFILTSADKGIIDSHELSKKYQGFIDKVLSSPTARRKTIIAVIIFSLFSYSLMPLGLVVNEFFPAIDQDQVLLTVELPPGTNQDTADKESLLLLEKLPSFEGVNTVLVQPGLGVGEFGAAQGEANSILFSLILDEEEDRELSSIDIAQNVRREFTDYNKGDLTVQELAGGPPVGADIVIQLLGDDLQVLDTYANRVISYLKTLEGVDNPEKSVSTGTSKIVYVPNKNKMAQLEISEGDIGLQLRTFASGFTLDEVRFEEDKQDIVFRNNSNIERPEALTTVTVSTDFGDIPLSSIGEFTLKPNPTEISREDGNRSLSVTAGVLPGFVPGSINGMLEKFADSELNLPSGYSWQTGGVNEENQSAVNSLMQAMVVAVILIIATMVVLLGSYRKAVIVFLVIPLAISGVFIIFGLTGTPLSFPAMIGMLALFGNLVLIKSLLLAR